jgi:hypothetical protein
LHSSAELRRRVLEEVNSGEVNVVGILTKLVSTLEKGDFQLFQEKISGLDSLSKLDLRGKQGSMPPKTLKSLVSLLLTNVIDADGSTVAAAVQATIALGLQNHVTLQLLDHIEAHCKSERVLGALQALRKLNGGTPETACRILAVLSHLSPAGLVDIRSGTVEPACLSSALDLLKSFPIACFEERVLAALEGLAQNPRAASTRHHAPTQRTHVIVAALSLILDKYAAALAQDQIGQERANAEAMQKNEERMQGGRPPVETAEPSDRSKLFGSVMATVQDCLTDPEVEVRRHATRLLSAASAGAVYIKVITHQLTTWLKSSDEFLQKCALADIIDLHFESSPATDMAVNLLETSDPRIRQVICPSAHCLTLQLAIVGIHEFLTSPLLQAHDTTPPDNMPYYSLLLLVKTYASAVSCANLAPVYIPGVY